MLAKVANCFAKRDPTSGGVRCLLDEASQREALARLELTDLWGIAGRLTARLNATHGAWCFEALPVSTSKKCPRIGKA
jgi:hypothetical protein